MTGEEARGFQVMRHLVGNNLKHLSFFFFFFFLMYEGIEKDRNISRIVYYFFKKLIVKVFIFGCG